MRSKAAQEELEAVYVQLLVVREQRRVEWNSKALLERFDALRRALGAIQVALGGHL